MLSRDRVISLLFLFLGCLVLLNINKDLEFKQGCPNLRKDSTDTRYICEVKSVERINNSFITFLSQGDGTKSGSYLLTFNNPTNLKFDTTERNLELTLVFDGRQKGYIILNKSPSKTFKEHTSTIQRVVYVSKSIREGETFSLMGFNEPLQAVKDIPEGKQVLTIKSFNNGEYYELGQ
jgi:hypothetical protein